VVQLAELYWLCFIGCFPCMSCCCSSWHDGRLLPQYAYLSGALSGVTEGVAFGPFQVIKV
jgi:hypothetical protein